MQFRIFYVDFMQGGNMMSCHDIGHALNEVGEVLEVIFCKGGLSVDNYKKLIRALQNGTMRCDGNSGEAIEYITEAIWPDEYLRCGRCLRIVSKKKAVCLSSLYRDMEALEKDYAYLDVSCPKCYESIVKPLLNEKQIEVIKSDTAHAFRRDE